MTGTGRIPLLALLVVILVTTTLMAFGCGSGEEGVAKPDAVATMAPATEAPAASTRTAETTVAGRYSTTPHRYLER